MGKDAAITACQFDVDVSENSLGDKIASPVLQTMAAPARCRTCQGVAEASVNRLFDTRFGIPGSFEVQRCRQCGLEQIFPVPTPAQLKELYERFYNFGGERGTVYTTLREWFFDSPLYRLWIRLDEDISFHTRQGRGRLLDIGCNEGRTLKNYARNGFQAEGAELNETAAAVARSAGFTVFTGSLDDFIPAAPFDVAVLSNVLEHALDPKAMLMSVRRLLKPEGQVWISCPNSESWLRPVFGPFWINWHVPFHISHFSANTLRSLLEECGFTLRETRQMTPALWVASSIMVRLFAREGKATRQLRNPMLMFALVALCRVLLFPLLSLGNRRGRGDCVAAVASRGGDPAVRASVCEL
ncbi:MAG: class I SAM-dependent methyltransferase [Candidatus Sulfotelmatobacter sp.]